MHVNESKICSARNLIQLIVSTGIPSPFGANEDFGSDVVDSGEENEESISIDTSFEMSR